MPLKKQNNFFEDWSKAIKSIGKGEGIKCRVACNTKCVKCDACEPEMVLVGIIPFCGKCWSKYIKKDEISLKLYHVWLKIWNKKIGNV